MSALSVDTDVAVPAVGGVTLATDVIRPAGPGRYPAILMRTVYDRTTHASVSLQVHALSLARAGYAVVLQDVRGRFASGGDFEPFVNEQADGTAALEWVRSMPWCNEDVAMGGVSYNAFSQLAVATSGHEGLAAILPALSPADVRDTWIRRGGALDIGFHLSWALNSIATLDRRSRNIDALLAALDDPWTTSAMGVDQPALRATPAASWFFDWAGAQDPYPNDPRVPTETDLAQVAAPSLVVAGWYDIFAAGSFRLFDALGDGSHIVTGPWDHSGLPLGRCIGNLDFGRRAVVDLHQLQIDWYNVHLRGSGSLPPKASLFITGANDWVQFDAWPPPEAPRRWYLDGAGGLGDAPAEPGELSFEVLVDAPTPAVGGRCYPWAPVLRSGAFDVSSRIRRSDVLTFTSDPLDTPIRAVGPAALTLSVSGDAALQQFVAALIDVHPDGGAWNVSDGVVESRRSRVTVDFGVIGHEFGRGHRIRIDVSGAAWPRYIVRSGRRTVHLGPSRLTMNEVS